MKKKFKTFVHSTCIDFDTIMFSAGKIGYQVEVSPEDLKKVVDYQISDIVVDGNVS
jgi:Cys-tRNA(Pro)/Cys-tRNA(Cys) deacylase